MHDTIVLIMQCHIVQFWKNAADFARSILSVLLVQYRKK